MKRIILLTAILFSIVNANAQCWKAVAAGDNIGFGFTIAIKTDGTLWAWGDNSHGELGDGTNVGKFTPEQISTDTTWKYISCENSNTLAIKSNGTLWAWGMNLYGELGDGTNIGHYIPEQIGTDTTWLSISAGWIHSMATKTDGSLWTWGDNSYGNLGDGTNIAENSPEQIGNETDWQSVSAGDDFSVALKNNGTLWAWGAKLTNIPQQIGTDTDWHLISANGINTFAIKNNGTLWGWGDNTYLQLQNSSNSYFFTPIQIDSSSNWQSIFNGSYSTHAIKSDGTLWGWGDDGFYETGVDTVYQYQQVEEVRFPTQITSATNWQLCASGGIDALALKTDGSLWSWGDNTYGELGIGVIPNYTLQKLPTQVPCEGIIPIELKSFSAQKQLSTVLIIWQTTSELNCKEYQIERSADGITFNQIGEVASANKLTGSNYIFTDPQPFNGNNYYRLKSIDINGSYTYSNIREVSFNLAGNQLSIYPNPVTDILNIESNFKSETLNINITDEAGRNILQTAKPNSQNLQISIANLNAGIYLLSVSDGTNTVSKKIIKE